MKIILLNGPPSSGKDTVALWLGKYYYDNGFNVITEKFAKPLKGMAAGLFGWEVSSPEYDYYFETREGKAEIIPGTDITYRQLLIDISEDFIKPRFGKEAFGKLMVQRIIDKISKGSNLEYVVISDCGFIEEVRPLLDYFDPFNIHVIHLYRDGATFIGDSRSYLDPQDFLYSCNVHDVTNDGDIIETVDKIIEFVGVI